MDVVVALKINLESDYVMLSEDEMLDDIKTYFRIKSHDKTLQMNATKINITEILVTKQ